jgi:hypothetical protein
MGSHFTDTIKLHFRNWWFVQRRAKPQDSTKPVAGILQCVVIATSPGRCPRPSIASISGGQPPSFASSQKAGYKPVPNGILARISKYPYFWENDFWVVRTPDTYSLLNNTSNSRPDILEHANCFRMQDHGSAIRSSSSAAGRPRAVVMFHPQNLLSH